MTNPAQTTLNVGTERENLIINAMLAAIKTEPTDWKDISKAVGEKAKIRSNGWMAVRNLLQLLMDNGYVKRAPFDPEAGERYVLLPR